MDTHRTSNLPTFPPGSDWSEPTRPPESPLEADRRRHGLLVLWLSVATFGLISFALLMGDETIYDGTNIDDVGPMDGLTTAAIVVAGVLFGATPLIIAIAKTIAAVRRTRPDTVRPALLISLYTAACGVTAAVFSIIGAEQTADQRRVLPDALRDGELLMGSTAALGLLPLVACLAGGLRWSALRSRVKA